MASTIPLPTKICHIIKHPDFDGYGFNLHSEKLKPGQFIGKVDVNSPAEAAGLQEGDRIIEVNGVSIIQESHKQVVQRIRAMSNEVRLIIVGAHASEGEKCLSELSAIHIAESTKENIKEIPGSAISKIIKHSLNGANNSLNAYSDEYTGARRNNSNKSLLREQSDHGFTFSNPLANTENVQNTPSCDLSRKEVYQSEVAKTSSCGLELPMTAAEMRAKLLSKKKYDPKAEIVDLKKKFEIIQKL